MIAIIRDREDFLNYVVGADSFLEYWPELETTGVEITFIEEHHYITSNGKMVNDTAFFTEDEMQYLISVES